jgi:DNA-binding GntR family transcriptional regulator
MGKRVEQDSLADQIYHLIKDSIIKGELKQGDRITELEISNKYGVSQSPVRETFLRLKEDGMVVSMRHKGTFISNLSLKDIKEIYSFREKMEPLAIQLAIGNAKEQDIINLQVLFKDMVEAGKLQDVDKVRNADVMFHTYIYKLANHSFMFRIWKLLIAKANRVWYLTSQVYFDDLHELALIHEPILDAFIQKDTEQCIVAFNIHLEFVKKKILSNLFCSLK